MKTRNGHLSSNWSGTWFLNGRLGKPREPWNFINGTMKSMKGLKSFVL